MHKQAQSASTQDDQDMFVDDNNKFVHDNKKKNEQASIQADAKNLSLLSLSTNQTLNEMMHQDQYWQYVFKNDPQYAHAVIEQAHAMNKTISADPAKYIPPVPPKKDQGGGGGAPPPAMGSNKMRTVLGQENVAGKFYIKRSEGEYRLKNTFVGKLLSGNVVVYDQNGTPFAISATGRGDVLAPKNGALSRILDEIEREMPKNIISSLEGVLGQLGIDNPEKVALATFNSLVGRSGIPVTDLIAALKSPSFATLFANPNTSTEEPKEISQIRKAVAEACLPYLNEISKAAALDGFSLQNEDRTDSYKNPADLAREQTETDDRRSKLLASYEHMQPNIVSKGFLVDDSNSHMPSLIMTAMSTEDKEVFVLAVKKMTSLISGHILQQELYKLRPLTNDEATRLADKFHTKEADTLKQLVKAYHGDDASFLRIASWAKDIGNDHLRNMLASIAVGQNRRDVIDSDPSLAISDDPNVTGVNMGFLKQLNPYDQESVNVLLKAHQKKRGQDGQIIGKIMEVCQTGNESALDALMGSSFFDTSLYAVSAMFDQDKVTPENRKEVQDAFMNAMSQASDETSANMASISILKKNPQDPLGQFMKIKPKNLAIAAPSLADEYIKRTRIGYDGKKIPTADEIHSMPDDPLPLAKQLNSISDFAALLVLCHFTAERVAKQKDSKAEYALEYIVSALDEYGMAGETKSILNLNRLRIDDNGLRRIMNPTKVPHSEVNVTHVTDSLDQGDLVSAARFLSTIYRVNPNSAIQILQNIPQNPAFASLLDERIASDRRIPGWAQRAKAPDLEASILPGGIVVLGSSGTWLMFDGEREYCFASSREDHLRIAMQKIEQGNHPSL